MIFTSFYFSVFLQRVDHGWVGHANYSTVEVRYHHPEHADYLTITASGRKRHRPERPHPPQQHPERASRSPSPPPSSPWEKLPFASVAAPAPPAPPLSQTT